ncbi:cell division cycle-associated protein 2 isoform X2 [Cynoglossus semilaevis]|uniref:cell division cycle-associated protein 2 isoform X2 n=1 Tax=Cynoglossus semilaevis TaxID=244447 RepID=UPI000D62C1AF|nr:cell division cycle-associated protein 2-like isoform X2 [Cynoglossus semilaevis]
MPGDEMSAANSEGDKKVTMSHPDFDNSSTPAHFSELSPCHFGISSQSFIPTLLTSKDNPAKIKARRRRSTIGVRGSPETNTLIRFMAQQRMKTPPTPATLTLRQKIASFQNLMDLEEKEVYELTPKQERTRDDNGKENHPPSETPPSPVHLKEKELLPTQSSVPPPHEDPVFPLLTPCRPSVSGIRSSGDEDSSGTSPVRKKEKKVHFGGLLSPELFDKNLPPSTPLQKGGTPFRAPTPARGLTLQSVLKKSGRSETPRTCGRPDLSSLIELSASPSLMLPHRSRVTFEDEGERTDVEEEEEIVLPSTKEIFAVMSSDAECLDFQPSSVNSASGEEVSFQTESGSDVITSSGTRDAAAPVTSGRKRARKNDSVRRSTRSSARAACGKMKIVLPSTKEIFAVMSSDAECLDFQPSSVNSASGEEVSFQTESDSDVITSCGTRDAAAPVTSGRKRAKKNDSVRRSTRSSARAACGKMKKSSAGSCRWSRGVDRSLYGSREYASKNPTLSPITERHSSGAEAAASSETDLTAQIARSVEDPTPPVVVQTSDNCVQPPDSAKKRRARAADSDLLGVEQSEDQSSSQQSSAKQTLVNSDLTSDPEPAEESEPLHSPPLAGNEVEQEPERDMRGNNNSSNSDSAPSQVDFYFEDVFKHVASRRQRSVRRSLRNQSNVVSDNSDVGLAWLPWTPSQSSRSLRRKSSRRLVGASLTNQTSASEETQETV